jgi:hypothetical protein
MRRCMYCQTTITNCMGYVLPRDILLVLEGRWDTKTMDYPRELCESFSCNQKWNQEIENEIANSNQ